MTIPDACTIAHGTLALTKTLTQSERSAIRMLIRFADLELERRLRIYAGRSETPDTGREEDTLQIRSYTVTVTDAHAHSVQLGTVDADNDLPLNGKLDAIRAALEGTTQSSIFAAFTATDTITVTATQP